MDRTILHVDMDAFFASVEQLDNKSLRGKPVIVGGTSERGVVSTCSYEARRYGVHSAMPAFIARNKCPMGIFLPVRYWRYKEISNEIFKIFFEITALVEPLSIDEAYLDVTEIKDKNGMEIANYIKSRVKKEIGLNLSIGISYNKFLAKLASDWNKPSGIKEITKEMIPEILLPLSISKIHGVGEKSLKKLNNMGIFTIADLYTLPMEFYVDYLGKWGLDIYNRIRGIDNREVSIHRERKSIGKERTLKVNTKDKEELLKYLNFFSCEIGKVLKEKGIEVKTITLKYKTESFENHTRSKTLLNYISSKEEIYSVLKELLTLEELKEEIRLIGGAVSSFKEGEVEQMTLF